MIGRARPVTGLVVLAVLAVGCGGPSAPPAPPAPVPLTAPNGLVLPPRAQTLRLDGIDGSGMCALVTRADLPKFGGTDGTGIPGEDEGLSLDGPNCTWTSAKPSYLWLGRFSPRKPVEEIFFRAERVLRIGGFWAFSQAPELRPRTTCYITVDTGPGQSLLAQFTNNPSDDPAMTHEKACGHAIELAEVMVGNARAQGR